MTEKKSFRSLRIKMLYTVLIAIVLGIVSFLIIWLTGNRIISDCVFTEQAIHRRTENMIVSLQSYVDDNGLASSDTEALRLWCQKQKNVSITVYRNEGGEETAGITEDFLTRETGSISDLESNSNYTANTINFSDGTFVVTLFDYSQDIYLQILLIVSIAVFFLTLLVVILMYTHRITNRVTWLSRQAVRITRGDPEVSLNLSGNDEISSLAFNFDEMKHSLFRQLQQEEHAWKTNQELITSISHDLRNPLTLMIGYTELLDSSQCDEDAETRKKYLKICKDNARHLKTLTDELFGYFLVFGNTEIAVHEQPYDAQILLEQLLGEEIAPMRNDGYDIRTEFELNCVMNTDIVLLKRIMDNLFSNMRKYALPNEPIRICAEQEENLVHFEFRNTVSPESAAVESTQIGLKTCSRLAEALGGSFVYQSNELIFTARLVLPVSVKHLPAENPAEPTHERMKESI